MLDTTAHEFVIEKGYDPTYGARPMRRGNDISKIHCGRNCSEATSKAGDRVEVTAADGKLTFHVVEPHSAAASAS